VTDPEKEERNSLAGIRRGRGYYPVNDERGILRRALISCDYQQKKREKGEDRSGSHSKGPESRGEKVAMAKKPTGSRKKEGRGGCAVGRKGS